MEHPTKTLPVVSVPEMSPERRILWEAANWMEKHGWRPNEHGCAIRALLEASDPVCHPGSYILAEEKLQRHIGDIPIAIWSDASDQETVVSTMRLVALS